MTKRIKRLPTAKNKDKMAKKPKYFKEFMFEIIKCSAKTAYSNLYRDDPLL